MPFPTPWPGVGSLRSTERGLSPTMADGHNVSVVIATYNRPRSLSACLQSLEEQTVPPFEVVVVIDGDQVEDTRAVVDAFESGNRLNVAEIVNGERRGATVSKNRGAEVASGDIVAFVDDDITLAPDWTAEILKGYEENEDAGAEGGH